MLAVVSSGDLEDSVGSILPIIDAFELLLMKLIAVVLFFFSLLDIPDFAFDSPFVFYVFFFGKLSGREFEFVLFIEVGVEVGESFSGLELAFEAEEAVFSGDRIVPVKGNVVLWKFLLKAAGSTIALVLQLDSMRTFGGVIDLRGLSFVRFLERFRFNFKIDVAILFF